MVVLALGWLLTGSAVVMLCRAGAQQDRARERAVALQCLQAEARGMLAHFIDLVSRN